MSGDWSDALALLACLEESERPGIEREGELEGSPRGVLEDQLAMGKVGTPSICERGAALGGCA